MKERVVEILKEIRPEFEFEGVENFFEEGMLDSFDLVSLVTALEAEYKVKIDGAAILPENFANVEAIVALLGKSGVQA